MIACEIIPVNYLLETDRVYTFVCVGVWVCVCLFVCTEDFIKLKSIYYVLES